MSKKITSEMLSELFTTIKVNDDERVVYNEKYLHATDDTIEHDIYQLASDIQQDLGVTFDFSYEIVPLAVDVLVDHYENADKPRDIDDIAELVDNAVPVYDHDLLKIANVGDYHHIDEAREVHGNDIDTIQACAAAWYSLIDLATRQLHDAITDYNNLGK